jgi:multidrug efflux pump subunit AcrB
LGHHIAEGYEHGMEWCLKRPATVFAIAIALTVVTGVIAMRLPREILPQVDEGSWSPRSSCPKAPPSRRTQRQIARVEAAARRLGSSNVFSRIGIATDEEILAGSEPGSSSVGQLIIPVPSGADASRFGDQLRAACRTWRRAPWHSTWRAIGIRQPDRPGRPADRVEIARPSQQQAELWSDSVRNRLRGLKTLADVRDAYAGTQEVVELTLERIASRSGGWPSRT